MSTIAKTFSAVGVSGALMLAAGQTGTYAITGTFVGMLLLERTLNGGNSWEALASYTGTQTAITISDPGTYRFRCSAYTSGSPAITLADLADTIREFANKDGVVVLTINEDGAIVLGSLTWSVPGVVAATNLTIANLFGLTGIEDTLTAHAGGTQAAAWALSATKSVHRVSVCATDADSVILPAAVAGQVHFVKNSSGHALQVFAALTETIDDVASATGISLAAGTGAWFVCVSTGKFYSVKGG